jgi:hypothetical protein
MAVEIKVAPDEKLELVRAQIIDTTLNSDYFNVTELSDTFSGGKNAFLIAGSALLEPNTEVKVQIRDSAGEVLYCEFSDGYPDEYYEGISKVVAVYVYPTEVAFGPATITLIGQIKDTLDLVKWERKINIDPSLPNTTKVRFYKRPTVSIVEQLSPIYSFDVTGSKVASNVTQSFANIKVSQLDTFAGDVKRVKVYRTSEGDISDYDLIQDILIESKELLTTTALSGSVVGDAGLFTSETLNKLWNTGSLTTALTSSRIDNGLSLKGSGYLRYTSSLNFNAGNTYEFAIDAFYSASTTSDMGIYVSGSQNGQTLIGTLNGVTPTKNLNDQVYTFTLDKTEPTASLYLSQSQSEWHVGNISLKLSEDSAFSPSEISFVTSMPTVLGNETYNFKFEFYDVNNNYVPVAVTQSALFTGGNNNINGTLTLISSSASSSNAALLALSQSVSGTIGTVTGSVSQSFVTSSAYSASLMSTSLAFSSSASSSISQSRAAAVSSSFGNIQTLANGGFSGSFISDTTIFAPVIGGNNGYISSLFKVGTAPSIYLDARQNPRKIFIGGVGDIGSYNSGSTTVYMDSDGKFSLGNKLTWDGGSLTLAGSINITGGQAATDIANAAASGSNALNYAVSNNATASAIAAGQAATTAAAAANYALVNANTASISAARDAAGFALINANTASIFTDTSGRVNRAPSTGTAGLYLGNEYMGYHNGNGLTSGWKTYMQNNGNFFLNGTAGFLSWNAGTDTLAIKGDVTATNITATNSGNIAGWTVDAANGLQKTSGNYILKLNSLGPKVSITKTNPVDSLDVVVLDARETIPQIVASDTGYIDYSNDGSSIGTAYAATAVNYDTGWVLGNGSSNQYGTGVHGIIGLVYATEEISIDSETFPSILGVIDSQVYTGNSYAKYECTLRVRRFPTSTDALNETNMNTTYGDRQVLVAKAEFGSTAGSVYENSKQVYGATIEAAGPGGINTDTGQANWYRVEILQYWSGTIVAGDDFDTIVLRRPASTIQVRFGRVGNGFSIFSPGGLQVYQGFRNYMNVSSPSGSTGVASNFCLIKGKSQIIGSLDVTSGFSAGSKQFKIKHPVNENKWLYHTSIEGPRADLIYRGHIQLENGSGSCLIDSSSRMSDGTFEALTKNSQLFLQNESGFDRVKGNVMTGSISVVSENSNSNDVISWMVVAERRDKDILNSPLYDSNGNYKPERYTSEYLEVFKKEILENVSGSI